MPDIRQWLETYPPEERDPATLRAAARILSARIAVVEADYAKRADRPVELGWLKEAFETDRAADAAMLARVSAALARHEGK